MSVVPEYKLVGRLTIPANSTIWIRRIEGGVPLGYVATDISALAASASKTGYYCLGDDSADDMVKFIADLISASNATQGGGPDTFVMTLDDTTGIITATFNDDPGDGLDLAFTDPAMNLPDDSLWVRDWLRWDSTGALDPMQILDGGSIVGFRAHAYGFYPQKVMLKDNDRFEPVSVQARPDTGGPFTLWIAKRLDHILTVWVFDGLPRGSTWNEYDQLKDLLEFASYGWPLRFYPDKSLTAAWVQTSNPYGYQVWVVDKDSTKWTPQPKVGNFLKRQRHELLLLSTDEA